jgi:hypothetical protein
MSRSSAVLALGLRRDSYIPLQNQRKKECSVEKLAKSTEKIEIACGEPKDGGQTLLSNPAKRRQ